jgi:leucyl aminopeptidase
MYSALFLQQFLSGTPDWLHLDVYAWEHTGRPGRPRGATETGLRAVLGLIEQRYGHTKKKRR